MPMACWERWEMFCFYFQKVADNSLSFAHVAIFCWNPFPKANLGTCQGWGFKEKSRYDGAAGGGGLLKCKGAIILCKTFSFLCLSSFISILLFKTRRKYEGKMKILATPKHSQSSTHASECTRFFGMEGSKVCLFKFA